MSTAPSMDVELNDAVASVDFPKDVEVAPTVEELSTLEHVSAPISFTACLIVFGQLCEGFALFGTAQILQNYIQFPAPGKGDNQPGALDRGRKMATAITTSFYLFYNLTPIAAAIIADQFWGAYKTLVVACFIYLLGLIVLVLSSLPISIDAGVALPALICALIILGVAVGGFSSTTGPFMAEQYTRTTPVIKEINGEKKIIDPELAIQSLFNWLYWAINLGALAGILIMTSVEKYHSFWLANLTALIIFPGFIFVLFIGRRRYVRMPPSGSLVVHGFRVTLTAVGNRWKSGKQLNNKHLLDYAKVTVPYIIGEASITPSENQFIDDLKQTMHACRVFALFPFYWICYNQTLGNLVSQAAQMNVGPIPNDILQAIDPLVVVMFVPIFEKIVYPTLRWCNIQLGPIARITCGFVVAALGMAWTGIVQHLIYSTGPNFNYATQPCLTCQKFNNLVVAWQIPSYFLMAISEIFAVITGLEYAFMKAPPSMKSMVVSIFYSTKAVGSALNLTLIPVNIDPKLLWMYASLAIVTFSIGIIFFISFRNDGKKTITKTRIIGHS